MLGRSDMPEIILNFRCDLDEQKSLALLRLAMLLHKDNDDSLDDNPRNNDYIFDVSQDNSTTIYMVRKYHIDRYHKRIIATHDVFIDFTEVYHKSGLETQLLNKKNLRVTFGIRRDDYIFSFHNLTQKGIIGVNADMFIKRGIEELILDAFHCQFKNLTKDERDRLQSGGYIKVVTSKPGGVEYEILPKTYAFIDRLGLR